MNGWDRVIAAVIDRRAELGWTQKRLAREAGVAERTVQNFEAGKRPQSLSRGKIERALGWKPGEMRRIADGREEKPDLLPPGLRAEIRETFAERGLPPDRAAAFEAILEAGLRGEPPPSSERPSGAPAKRAAAS